MKFYSLGKALKRHRESCGLTQQQVARALNVDRSTYTYYETGNTTPSAPVIVKISKIFNVSYNVFMDLFDDTTYEMANQNGGIQADDYLGNIAHDIRRPSDGLQERRHDPREAIERIYDISNDERQLLALFRVLPSEAKEELLKVADELNPVKKNK